MRGFGFSRWILSDKKGLLPIGFSSYIHLMCIIHNVFMCFALWNYTFLLPHPHCHNFILPPNQFRPQNIMRPQILMLCVVLTDRWLCSQHSKWLGEVWHWHTSNPLLYIQIGQPPRLPMFAMFAVLVIVAPCWC